uniref:Uncharacterized protein n=1 Tax=Pleurotus citrinopileatus TaxID=98342 RepID=A0A2K9YPG3_PLECI|nr:hypothetical protein [Pleurotus citrinopileatus]AUW35275.1 hypothetical protein [Pleurotus citrinopileatus]
MYNSNYIYSLFPFVNLDIITNTSSSLSGYHKMIYGIFMLSILILWCIIQIGGYFLFIYLLQNSNLEEKYPKYKKLFLYFKNINIVYIIIEIIFVVLILLSLIGTCINLLFFT